MDRFSKILELVSKEQRGLEIGPSYSPAAPKRDGWNVKIADHATAEELRAKYSAWNVDPGAIEDVDYVIGEVGLLDSIRERESFDFVIASHVIEHLPNPVRFLIECETLLKPGGVVSLVVPDKRACFDAFKPLTSTGDFLQAYWEDRKRHSAGAIFDGLSLHTLVNDQIIFPTGVGAGEVKLAHTPKEAFERASQYLQSAAYMDIHAWVFTPGSFMAIVQDLREIGLIGLELANAYPTEGFEFFLALRKAGSGKPREVTRRVEDMRQVLIESSLQS